ncbi:cobalamin biosynthesis protein CbiN [Bacillus cereus]|uniref:cobalamin biosynthesis protein CbiN n=1 Tax=Bacillus cereus TaxID=1396 RepID=UPI0018795D14|nr:cobalamin biosynthesis protein CbiN [Bacillus cereus]MBE7121760.1 cobalamin biosynthesis protein CbiN [Bacillus cereus]
MKRILHMLPVVIICGFILIVFPDKSYACDCMKKSPEDAFQKNDVVFEGKVLEVQEKDGGGIKTLFEVKKIWKGTSSSQIIIYTSSSSSCAFRFAEGGEYIVFSSHRGEEKLLETSICSGTKRLDEAEVEKTALSHIAKESVPTKKVSLKGNMVNGFRWGQLVIISIGVLLIIAIAILVVRRTRKK